MNFHVLLSIYCQLLWVQHQLSAYSLAFVYIHSKLWNCFCGATAAPLVFCYCMLHGCGPEDW